MIRSGLLAMCCGAMAFMTAGPEAWAYEYRYNLSSHSAALFRDLVSGRAWIVHRPENRKYRNRVWGAYFDPGGLAYICSNPKGEYKSVQLVWQVVDSKKHGSLLNIRAPGTKPDPKQGKKHAPLFYEPETGRLHDEGWWKPKSIWYVAKDGWVQDSWPRVLKDACPDLPLPADMAINERQTSRRMDELRGQDLEAPIRNHPGSELRRLGAVGIGASGNKPTVTKADLDRFFAEHNGTIVETPPGRRYALVTAPQGPELWHLGDDDEEIVDVARGSYSDDGKLLTWWFGKQNEDGSYPIGEAFPLLPTGQRHAAHRLMDWIIAEGEVPFPDREGLRFEAGGKVTAAIGATGTWWWSRGSLHVRLGGEVATYPWRPLADRLGWPG